MRRSVQCIMENGGSDPDAVWHHRSDGSRHEGRSTGRDTFGGDFGARHYNQWGFTAYVCDSASTVGAAVWVGACGGPRHCCIRRERPRRARRREVWGFVPFFTMGNAIGSPTSIFRTALRLALAMCAGLAHNVGRSWCGVINSPSSGDHFRRRYQTASWETFAATRPSSQITLGRLVIVVDDDDDV